MKTSGLKLLGMLSTTFLIVITCLANPTWASNSSYYSMQPKAGYDPIVIAFGVCKMTNGTEATNTATYSYVNGTSATKAFSVSSQATASPAVTYYVKPGTWKVELENTCIQQTLSTYISISNGTWQYANNCTKDSTDANCAAGHLMPPLPDSAQAGGPNLTPGCQQNHFTPPPPPQLVCGDNTKTTGWDDERIKITNNCADDAYIVLTPPTADATYKQYNTDLWIQAANRVKGGMDKMYANPQNSTSALMFRKKVNSGESMYLPVPKGGIASGNISVLLNCAQDPEGVGWPGNCTIGAVPGTPSTGVGTIFEYSAGCTYTSKEDRKNKCTINPSSDKLYCMDSSDYYDISMVNGFSIPMKASFENATDYKCNFAEMNGIADLYDCPKENGNTISATGNYVEPYSNPQLKDGVGLHITNNATTKGKVRDDYRAACTTPAQWLYKPGGQSPKNQKPVALTDSPQSYSDLSISNWYQCKGMLPDEDPSDPANCKGPGCGGPQCAVGPDGELGEYSTSNIIQGHGIPYTNYVKYLKYIGADAYAWQFNDDASTVLCKKAGAQVHLELCPGPEGIEPYQKPYTKQKWSFNGKECLPTPDTSAEYDTLLGCMKENYSYTCQQEEVQKLGPKGTVYSAKLNYCKPYRLLNDKSPTNDGVVPMSYQDCVNKEAQCQKYGPTSGGLVAQ